MDDEISSNLEDINIQANLEQLLREAPPTTCGACRTAMDAESVYVNVSVQFSWYDIYHGAASGFVPAFPSFSDPTRYSGHVRYVCPTCGASLRHQQAVTRHGATFHFQPPEETVVS